MTTPKKTPEQFVRILENGIRAVLKDKQSSSADKLKAIEIGAKIAAVQFKMKGGDEDAFFG